MTTQAEDFSAVRAEANQTAEAVSALRKLYADGKIPEKDFDFVESLLRSHDRRGLSISQARWVGKLVARFTQSTQASLQIGSMTGLVQLLTRARENGLKFPKLWLRLPNSQDLRITIAGERSKAPGQLVLTDGEAFGQNKYFGRISHEGELTLGRDGHEVRTALTELLTRLSADPAGVAAEFGHLTGHCCFCSLQLTDERSTEVGYGRRCAQKFGLPWGKQ